MGLRAPMILRAPSRPRLILDHDFAGRQIIGSRDEQQDSYAFSIVDGDDEGAERLLVVIADGMGGHLGGRQASQTALKAFVDAFFEALDAPTESKGDGKDANKGASALRDDALAVGATHDAGSREATALQYALTAANRAVDEMIETDPDTLGEAGTTLVAALVNRQFVHWISVGDSPLLLWRKGKLAQLNADHSMRRVLAEKVAARQMRASDAKIHPERNTLIAALNGAEILKIDIPAEPFALKRGDILLAASDGLLTLAHAEISKTLKKLRAAPAVEVVHRLLEGALEKAHPKQDNTTLAVVRI